jgi:hypothetical protein
MGRWQMAGVPRIVRESPKGPKSRPEIGIPVKARIRWHHGDEPVISVFLVAWTQNAAEIMWRPPGESENRTDWIPRHDVGGPDGADPPAVEMPPHTVAGRPKQRW